MALSGVKACKFEQLEPRLLMSSVSNLQNLFASAESLFLAPTDSIVVDGNISDSQDRQVYTFTTTARGKLSVQMAAESGSIDPYLELFTSSGRRVRSNNNASRDTLDSRISLNVISGQTYYLVASGGIEGAGQFALTLTSDPKDDIGNAQASAKQKRLSRSRGSGRFAGTINYAQDVDFFEFVATQSGLMRIDQSVRGRNNSLQGQVLVYDGQDQLVATSGQANGTTNIEVVRGETYFLAVTGLSGSQGKYKINIAPTESHLFTSAEQVNVPSEGSISIDADRLSATAAHGYVFTANAKGFVYINMAADSSGIDPYLQVYNSKKRRIGKNDKYLSQHRT